MFKQAPITWSIRYSCRTPEFPGYRRDNGCGVVGKEVAAETFNTSGGGGIDFRIIEYDATPIGLLGGGSRQLVGVSFIGDQLRNPGYYFRDEGNPHKKIIMPLPEHRRFQIADLIWGLADGEIGGRFAERAVWNIFSSLSGLETKDEGGFLCQFWPELYRVILERRTLLEEGYNYTTKE